MGQKFVSRCVIKFHSVSLERLELNLKRLKHSSKPVPFSVYRMIFKFEELGILNIFNKSVIVVFGIRN